MTVHTSLSNCRHSFFFSLQALWQVQNEVKIKRERKDEKKKKRRIFQKRSTQSMRDETMDYVNGRSE
jgi:hypothetical protein